MRRISIVLVVFGIISGGLFNSCASVEDDAAERKDGFSNTAKTREDSLYKKVMEGHDVGMAKMGKLTAALKKVNQQLDSLNALTQPAQKEIGIYKSKLEKLKESLEQAQAGMNQWMDEFSPEAGAESKEARINYLQAEQTKVQKVRDSILISLSRADSVLVGR